MFISLSFRQFSHDPSEDVLPRLPFWGLLLVWRPFSLEWENFISVNLAGGDGGTRGTLKIALRFHQLK